MGNWRCLKGVVAYGDCYEVSDDGLVRNIVRNRLLKPRIKRGYEQVVLCLDGYHRSYFIHRLVALAFIPSGDENLQVNHIDGNKRNNNISNLEWVTPKENTKHAIETGLRCNREEHAAHMRRIHSKPVVQYDASGKVLSIYDSSVEASKITGIKADTISKQCRLKRNSRYESFYFRFLENVCVGGDYHRSN